MNGLTNNTIVIRLIRMVRPTAMIFAKRLFTHLPITVTLSLLLLEFTGYVSNAEVQPKSALLELKIVIGPTPALLLITGILFAIFYSSAVRNMPTSSPSLRRDVNKRGSFATSRNRTLK
jgi:Na+/melibiose symporter-like transporter